MPEVVDVTAWLSDDGLTPPIRDRVMVQTVFWSWQSDQPSRETRNIIRDALVSALDRIAIEVEEAERPEIDHDTKDAPGPDIVATILAKIQQAAVFVADVTPIAVSTAVSRSPTPMC
ncbi:MAG: hypothetical protein IPF97_08165 [Sphingomonadales bacterium]|nr:hypothetical protein [Sphingomonadales bacterium]